MQASPWRLRSTAKRAPGFAGLGGLHPRLTRVAAQWVAQATAGAFLTYSGKRGVWGGAGPLYFLPANPGLRPYGDRRKNGPRGRARAGRRAWALQDLCPSCKAAGPRARREAGGPAWLASYLKRMGARRRAPALSGGAAQGPAGPATPIGRGRSPGSHLRCARPGAPAGTPSTPCGGWEAEPAELDGAHKATAS